MKLLKARLPLNIEMLARTCVCANRIFVQSGIYDEFANALAKKVSEMKVGDGFEEGVVQGPIIDQQGFDKVTRHVADAIDNGAKVITGGKAHELGGTFFEPTVITGATAAMQLIVKRRSDLLQLCLNLKQKKRLSNQPMIQFSASQLIISPKM